MKRPFPHGLDAPPVVVPFAGVSAACRLIVPFGTPHRLPVRFTGMRWSAITPGLAARAMIWSRAVSRPRAGAVRNRARPCVRASGGHILIGDIRHAAAYAAILRGRRLAVTVERG